MLSVLASEEEQFRPINGRISGESRGYAVPENIADHHAYRAAGSIRRVINWIPTTARMVSRAPRREPLPTRVGQLRGAGRVWLSLSEKSPGKSAESRLAVVHVVRDSADL